MATFTTLPELIDALGSHGDQPALIRIGAENDQGVSFAELKQQVVQLARGLINWGITPGDHVAIMAAGGPETVIAALGILRAGGVVVPIDVQSSDDVLGHILGDADPRLVFAPQDTVEQLRRLDEDRALFSVDSKGDAAGDDDTDAVDAEHWSALFKDESDAELPSRSAEDPAALFYTSGTTGRPKGVPLTHRNICVSINAILGTDFIQPDDRMLLPLPLHHVYPFVVGTLCPLALGVGMVFPAGLTGPQLVQALNQGRASIVLGVPRLYRALYEGIAERAGQSFAGRILFNALLPVSVALRRGTGMRLGRLVFKTLHQRMGGRLRVLASGGSALDEDLAWKLLGLGWDIAAGYGLTETSPLIAFSTPEQFAPEHVGFPLPDIDLNLDRKALEQREDEVPTDEHQGGEIVVRGPNVFSGYHNLPEETDKRLQDGWFRTGDLGFVDEKGYLHITGRVSTLIVTEGGENVQPDAVESAYSDSPYVREVGVLEDERKLAAVIVPDPKTIGKDGLEEDEAIRQAVSTVSKRLPSYQRLGAYQISREALPRTRLGKIRRHLLKERYQALKSGEDDQAGGGPMPIEDMSDRDRALLENPNARRIWAWLADKYADRPLTPDTTMQADLGVDSLDWLGISMEVGERTGVELNEEAIADIDTVRDLLTLVAESEQSGDTPSQFAPFENPEQAVSERQKHWLEPLNGTQIVLGWMLLYLIKILAKLLFRVEAVGKADWSDHNGVLLTPDHASYLDPFVLAAVLDWNTMRRTRWAGWTGVAFANPFNRFFSRLAQAVPVDSERSLSSTLAFATIVLRQHDNLVWFPEGQRSPQGRMLPFKPGVGLLLHHTDAKAVPVHLHGAHDALPVGAWMIRPRKIVVRFGEAVSADVLESEGEGESPQDRIANALRQRLANLRDDRGKQ